jgi:hypothetical protein
MVWRAVVLAAIWAMEQGKIRLWSLVHAPPRQGSAIQQAVSKASTSFWSALHDLPDMIGLFRAGMKSALIILSCVFASRFPCARTERLCFPHKH